MPVGNDIINLIRFIRMDIGDDGSTKTFSDLQIINTVQKATIRIDSKLGACLNPPQSGGLIQFEQTISGISSPLASGRFVLPSGSLLVGLADPLFNLVLLKSECLLAKRNYFDAAGKAIRVRDGDTEIDTSVGFAGLQGLVTGEGGPCFEYKEALNDYCKFLQRDLNGDITQWADIIWKGSVKKHLTHPELGVDGSVKTELLADFSDYLSSDNNQGSNADPSTKTGPDRNT